VVRDRQTDTQTNTDGCDQYTFRLGYASREMYNYHLYSIVGSEDAEALTAVRVDYS